MSDGDVSDELLGDHLAEAEQPTDAGLATLRALCERVLKTEREIAATEADLKLQKEKLRELTERELPEKMVALGVSRYVLTDGTEVQLKPFSAVGIKKDEDSEEPLELAFGVLRQVGGADLIKNVVAVEFGRGEDEQARELVSHLKELGHEPTQKRSVNYQTLNAWFREKLRADQLFRLPEEAFTCFVGQVAKLKKPKRSTP